MKKAVLRQLVRISVLAGVAPVLLSCSLSRRNSASGGDDESSLKACKAPATSSSWKWKPATFNGVRLEIPERFIERLEVDTRSRMWEYGPRQIRLILTTEPHTERQVPFFAGRCEMELGDRSVEVVSSTTSDNDRVLTARVPNVEGGFDLIVVVSTRYPQEIDALRRVIASAKVAEPTGH
ncbi:MAG: hypothetical protein ABI877_16305 [Gemmatimonadaceae bacterium]